MNVSSLVHGEGSLLGIEIIFTTRAFTCAHMLAIDPSPSCGSSNAWVCVLILD